MPLINDILTEDKKKKKKRRSPWASIEDLLSVEKDNSHVDEVTKQDINPNLAQKSDALPNALISPIDASTGGASPNISTHKIIEPSSTRPSEPGSNQVQKHGSIYSIDQTLNPVIEPGLNQVQIRTSVIDHKFQTVKETFSEATKTPARPIEPSLNRVQKLGSTSTNVQPISSPVEPGSNQVHKLGSIFSESINWVQTTSGSTLNQVQIPGSNLVQKPGSIDRDLFSLRGNNKIVFDHFSKLLVELQEPQIFISYSDVVRQFSIPMESVKTVFKRLAMKKLLTSKSIAGGGPLAKRILSLPMENRSATYRYLIHSNKIEPGLNQVQKQGSQHGSSASSKLVSNINTNLLGSDDSNFSRSGLNTSLPDFLNADISSLSNFGVYKKQLMDLHNQKQSFELNQMEDFIWKFKEYVSDSEKVRGVRSIPALFVTLARQLASGYDPLESIQTPEQKLLEELLERNKKALMELKRKKEESKAIEFELWFEKLNRQERDELAPPNSIVESGSELQKRSLMGYFDKAVWTG